MRRSEVYNLPKLPLASIKADAAPGLYRIQGESEHFSSQFYFVDRDEFGPATILKIARVDVGRSLPMPMGCDAWRITDKDGNERRIVVADVALEGEVVMGHAL